MEVLYNHFENLNKNHFDDGNIDMDIDVNNLSPEMYNILNSLITIEEIKNVVKGLKNEKSSGIDGVINEYIKYTIDDMLHIYVLLFNIILDKGIIPESWGKGILIPIFKDKRSKSDPNPHRGVTLNSCISKMFSAVLYNRLTKSSAEFELITNAQAGFRKGFSTNDNIFILHALISIYFSFGKNFLCSFIDFKSAFDTVWRIGLWQKMQKSNAQGNIYKLYVPEYKDLYSKRK